MLHHPDSLYLGARVDSLVKLKAYQEMDVSVLGMNPGQGRLTGMMGSLQVRMADGTVFNVGSGFTDQQRHDPPKKGQTIMVRYNGVTEKGSHVLPALYEKKPRSRRDRFVSER
ncbi:hypothetical protein [Salinivibrio socompensis]|uniref:hypothetical protein n=1 Tax=Salinivibrio socompensis TaxID=1510206 RepID=UPI0006846F70|nr:hypothetical protein [Salinivibrio socompensis]